MLKKCALISLLFSVLFLMSCATTYTMGEHFNTEFVKKIKIGITTEKEIIDNFGEPWKKGMSNGNIIYIYSYEEVTFHHDDSVEKIGDSLIIEFDNNNTVKNYYFNVPGKEPVIIGLMMHERNKEKQEQNTQNQMINYN